MRFDLHPFPDIEAARSWGRDEIDSAATDARGRLLSLLPGQESVYLAKYTEALAITGGGVSPDPVAFPWIAAEAQLTCQPLAVVAERIKQKGDLWQKVHGPQIEALRVSAKSELMALVEISAVVKTVRTAQFALRSVGLGSV